MSSPDKKSAALALIQDKDVGAAIPLTKLQAVAVEQFQRIARDTRETPLRAILLGLTLHRVKASMPHGTFEAWKKSNVTAGNIWTESTTRKNCSLYMRLALAAIESTGATKPQLLALPGDQSELALKGEGEARVFMDQLQDYVGERTIEEILRDEGIKEGGAATKKRKLAKGAKPATAAEKAQSVQDRFNEIESALRTAISAATDKATWMTFDRKQHDSLKAIFTDASERLDAIHAKTHGRAAKK